MSVITKISVVVWGIISAIMLGFLTVPIVVLLLRGLSASAWQDLPTQGVVWSAIQLSFITTSITIVINLLFGTPLAYYLARSRWRGKRWLNICVELPIVLPPAVAGLALLLTFGRRGALGDILGQFNISLPFTTAAVVLAQVFVSAPFFIRSAQVGFASVDKEIEDSARVDGASEQQVLWYITLPLTRRAILAGATLSWARALGEFGATILFAGSLQGRTQTMPLLVYGVLERDIDAAILTGMMLVLLAMLALGVAQALHGRNE